MRERVALYGGTVLAGPGPDGGWRVQASQPAGDDRRTTLTVPVLLVDDQELLRRGFRMVLEEEAGSAGASARPQTASEAVRLAAKLAPT